MKVINHFIFILLVIFLMTSVSTVFVFAGNQKEAEKEQQKIIETWKKYSSPGEMHKYLQYFVGHWESVQNIFPRSAGDEVMVMYQEIHVESLFEGRFIKAHIKAKKKSMGSYTETIVITGYDNYKQKVISTTFSNKATDFTILTGTLDKSGKTRIDTGMRTNIFTGREYKIRAVTTIINPDKYIYEYYEPDPNGSEFKVMEITYTRKK
ncbi:MAG: DUF1579 family protein [Candidatus Aminicenantes bacterium]|nr:MAG: DUF1579 family protein [Candidatus Aminicenantes bacterium]